MMICPCESLRCESWEWKGEPLECVVSGRSSLHAGMVGEAPSSPHGPSDAELKLGDGEDGGMGTGEGAYEL
ncbi:hypothetical protein SERLADRAFT_378195, partial [Serpula lacrymans var. lacrymans S7.9]